jgi:hypothetical protein
MCFPLFSTGMDTEKSTEILPRHPALKPAVEHMPLGIDQRKTKNTATSTGLIQTLIQWFFPGSKAAGT